jgi:hypothetical protein
MSNILTTTRNAIWTKLEADATLVTLMKGRSFLKFAGGLKKRLIVEPAQCPILAMAPSGAVEMPGVKEMQTPYRNPSPWRHGYQWQLDTAGENCGDLEELFGRVVYVLATQFPYGLDTLSDVAFEDVAIEPIPDEKDALILWEARFRTVVTFRAPYIPT